MTEASKRALEGLRDLSTVQWYVIPLLAVVFYIYVVEIKKARKSGNWDAVFAAALPSHKTGRRSAAYRPRA